MPLPRITGTAAFRLATLYGLLFALGAVVLVAFFDLTVADYARRSLRDDVTSEIQLLERTAPGGNATGIAALVRERQRVLGSSAFYYLVFGPGGDLLAGDLPVSAGRRGWAEVQVPAPPESREYAEEMAEVRTLGETLPGGGLLVVGRSTYDFHELRETLVEATAAAGGLILLMALCVAFLIGRQVLSRIDRVNAAAARIMEGRLDERLPAMGMGAEFDRLAANLNAMLDRINGLMEGLRQVSSDVAHDLRTPLTRLRGRLEAALGDGAPNPERDALAQAAMAQVDEILATFSSLLRIAQVEGGGREGFRPVNLSEVVERVQQAYEPVAEDEGRAFAGHVAPDLQVDGDENLLAQLVSNLLENAFAHTPPPGAVELSVRAEGTRAVISVADKGPGIPPDERAKVTRRFYRLDRSRTTPGAGLGLAMVQAVAQLHEGELVLSDNRPGLVARVILPRRPRVQPSAPSAPP
ncbi:MAG: HAMP domain-containing protein [Alphaproteobacteria bacterium]|nr:HAMP domain-containing protein [Alphaproteobacteria bacterium]